MKTANNTLYTRFNVCSSHGSITASALTGEVIEIVPFHLNKDTDRNFLSIMKFDIDEYKEYYKVSAMPSDVDILDLGYEYYDGRELLYEEPAHDWR